MKLPKAFEMYKFNHYLKELKEDAAFLHDFEGKNMSIKEIIAHNGRKLKIIQSHITHLELVLDEVKKIADKIDE